MDKSKSLYYYGFTVQVMKKVCKASGPTDVTLKDVDVQSLLGLTSEKLIFWTTTFNFINSTFIQAFRATHL